MNLEVVRFSGAEETTLGLWFDVTTGVRQFWCFTLEDRYRAVKVSGSTRIPAATYKLELRTHGGWHEAYSKPGHWAYEFHKGMIEITNVEGFTDILVHPLNRHTETKGCIGVGDGVSQNITDEGLLQSSRAAYRRIYPPIAAALLAGEPVALHVRDDFGS